MGKRERQERRAVGIRAPAEGSRGNAQGGDATPTAQPLDTDSPRR